MNIFKELKNDEIESLDILSSFSTCIKLTCSVFWMISDMNWYCITCTCGPAWKITVVNLLRKNPFTVLVCEKTVLLNVHLNCMHSLS